MLSCLMFSGVLLYGLLLYGLLLPKMHLCLKAPSILYSTLYTQYLHSYRNSLLSHIIIIPESNPPILCILLRFSYEFLTETGHFLIFRISSVQILHNIRLVLPFLVFRPYYSCSVYGHFSSFSVFIRTETNRHSITLSGFVETNY